MKIIMRVSFITIVLQIVALSTMAQINTVPQDNANDRFLIEPFIGMERPGLSIIGFDNNGNDQFGLGLKQILNSAWDSNGSTSRDIVIKIFNISTVSDVNPQPQDDDAIENNSNILQYKAFEALSSYVLEHNGIDSTTSIDTYQIPIRSHSVALNDFTQSIMAVANAGKLVGTEDDYVKDVESLENIARALDLYLALENAYEEWDHSEWDDPNSTVLLSEQEKTTLMDEFYDSVVGFYNDRLNNEDNFLASLFDVQEDEVEAGNRPLKGHFAVGYSTLGLQTPSSQNPQEIFMIFHEAKHRAADHENGNRYYYWTYQTNKGDSYWGEGPYYLNYVLRDAIQFWHAVRANGQFGDTITDPFTNSWFLDPIEWLADISTPDGYVPHLSMTGINFQSAVLR